MNYLYAQLDENNKCVGLSQLASEVKTDTLIPIDTLDALLIGKKYENGFFVDAEAEEPKPESLNINEVIQAELLLNQMDLLERTEAIEASNAEILLMLVKGGASDV